jgi:hypothetical protein
MESGAATKVSQDHKELSAIAYCTPRSNGFSWSLWMVDEEGLPEWKELPSLREFVSRMRTEGWVLKKTRSDLDFSETATIHLWFKQ